MRPGYLLLHIILYLEAQKVNFAGKFSCPYLVPDSRCKPEQEKILQMAYVRSFIINLVFLKFLSIGIRYQQHG